MLAIAGLLLSSLLGSSPAWAQVPPIDKYRLSAKPVTADAVWITAMPGSVPAGAQVQVVNVRTWAQVYPVVPASDGSFITAIEGVNGDRFALTVIVDDENASSPAYVTAAALVIKNPYRATGYWWVGQGHTHTANSDGADQPASLEAAYAAAGYDFVVSTDHRGSPTPLHTAPDDGMTPDPVSAGADLLWIRGAEIGNAGVHMGSWGTSANVALDDIPITQQAVDATRALGGIAAINHPENDDPPYAWDWHAEIAPLRNLSLIEAFNAKNSTEGVGGNHLVDAIDLADDFQQVWWIGTDDCHDLGLQSEFNRYAIVVQTDTAAINQADILAAADAGRLYIRESAQGPVISGVGLAGDVASVTLADVSSNYEVAWYKRGGELLERDLAVDTTASYTANGSEGYVRAEVTRLADGKKAWTQPLFIANGRDLAVAASSAALVDNNSTTVWDAGSATGSFVVDTGSVRNLNAIRVDWDGSGGRRFNYFIEASDSGAFAGEQRQATRRTFSNRQSLTLDFFDERARFLRVVVTGQSAGAAASARVREVEVFEATPARTSLYIDNVNGDDANSGLAGSPWRTFNYARDRVRPRDTLNFMQNLQPYPGMMQLGPDQSGKHAGATVEYRGAAGVPARVNAGGAEWGVTITGVQWLEWTDFDISLAYTANLFVNAAANVTIARNRLHDSQGRGVLGTGDFTLAYNLVYGNGTEGVMLYTNGTNARVFNNVIYGNGTHGLAIQNFGAISAEVRNNVIAGNGEYALWATNNAYVQDSHNCGTGPYSGFWADEGYVFADPKLADPASGDFTLQLTSPCIDAGIDLDFPADFDGEPVRDVLAVPNTGSPGAFSRRYVDIGAHEACDTACNGGGGGCH